MQPIRLICLLSRLLSSCPILLSILLTAYPRVPHPVFRQKSSITYQQEEVTLKSDDRVKDMITVNKEIDQKCTGPGLFLFANAPSFSPENSGKILEKSWPNNRGESARLVE